MTTKKVVSPGPVGSSRTYQVRRAAGSQRSAAVPVGEEERMIAPTPTQPPKYSTAVASAGSLAETSR